MSPSADWASFAPPPGRFERGPSWSRRCLRFSPPARERGLRSERPLVAAGGWASGALRAANLLLPVAVCFIYVALAATDLLVRFIRSILGQGNQAIAWILLGVPPWRSLLSGVMVGAALGALWVLGMKWEVAYWIVWPGLLFIVALSVFTQAFRMQPGSWAEPGPWSLWIGKGTLFIGPGIGSGAGGVLPLAMAAVFLLFPPRAVNEPFRLLLSPSRMISSWLCVPDDRTASRSEALLAAALDPDPSRVEAACRAEGIGVPLRVPEAFLAGLREHVELLRQERIRERGKREVPGLDQR